MSHLTNKYIPLFKIALLDDIKSGLMASQANGILGLAIESLELTQIKTIFELDSFIRGVLNLALHIEQSKYGFKLDTHPQHIQSLYKAIANKHKEIWARNSFPSYEAQIFELSKLPLLTMTNTAPKTLAIYVNYLKEINTNVVIPQLPQIKSTLNRQPVELAIIDTQIITAFAPGQDDTQKLNDLKNHVQVAKNFYVNHSNNIWFSLFHRHGESGRIRASKFCEEFQKITDYEDAYKTLLNFLQSNQNGNTHPHSFRTMLLSSLVNTELQSYEHISKNYDDILNSLSSLLPSQLAPII